MKTEPERTMIYKTKMTEKKFNAQLMEKLVTALVLAITAPTNEQARKAVWLVGELAGRLEPKDIEVCKAQALARSSAAKNH